MFIINPYIFTAAGYTIEGSGLFNGTDGKLTRTISSAGNRKTFILEVIFKRGGSASSFLTAYSSGTDTFYTYLSSDQVYIQNYVSGTQMELKSDAKLRDFSAWYHLIYAIDTTQSTDTDRVKAWVNGVELTWASSPRTYPAQDLELKWNTGSQEHQIGHSATTYSQDYFARAAAYDGATMTDPVTDGFGEYDDNGVWVVKNSSDLSSLTGQALISQGTGSVIGTMNVRTSNAFDGNNNQNDGNSASHDFAATTVTLGKDFGAGNAKVVNQVRCWGYNGGGFTSNAGQTCTIAVIGSNTGLGSDEVTLFTSGTITDSSNANAQNFSFSNSTAYRYVYINLTQGVSNYFFVAELEFYEEVTVGFGTTGFLIEGGAAFTNGTDSSGNSQNFTKGGTITNVNDTLTDKASDNFGNYVTWSPIDKDSNVTLSEGNTIAEQDSTGAFKSVLATQVVPSTGKWVWEIKQSGGNPFGGYATTGVAATNVARSIGRSGSGAITFDVNGSNLRKFQSASPTESNHVTGGVSISSGEAFQFAVDSDAEQLEIYINNTKQGSTLDISSLTKPYKIISQLYSGGTVDHTLVANSANFENNVPAGGYKTINTANLPAPTVTKPSDFFKTVLFSGTGSAQNIDTVGFSPDLLIIKSRTSTANFNWIDRVRGEANILWSNAAVAQSAESTSVTGFRDEGFSVGSDSGSYVNISGQTMVAFCMKAGGSGSSNSDGDIASTVSVASHGGFSIVKYDPGSGGSPGDTVGHGLSRAPNFIILKTLENVGDKNWSVGSDDIGWTNNLFLNLTNAKSAGSGPWNDTAPTSSVFSIGSDRDNDAAYIAYCFAKTPGLIACGSYTGNNDADGTYVVVDDGASGFRPAWLLMKNINDSENWVLMDSVRSPFNPVDGYLSTNTATSDTGATGLPLDFTANGFKQRNNSNMTNEDTIIYLAFAEHPFGGDGVAQAKAR